MLYKLLGMAVWRLGTWVVRRKYGRMMPPRPLLAGGAIALVAGVGLALARRGGNSG